MSPTERPRSPESDWNQPAGAMVSLEGREKFLLQKPVRKEVAAKIKPRVDEEEIILSHKTKKDVSVTDRHRKISGLESKRRGRGARPAEFPNDLDSGMSLQQTWKGRWTEALSSLVGYGEGGHGRPFQLCTSVPSSELRLKLPFSQEQKGG